MRPSILATVLAGALAIPGVALACICGLVPTAYTCPACPTVTTSTSGCPVPTTATTPTTIRRCYYEPRTTYRRVVQRIPQLTWAQTCYYDPIFGVTRSLLVPTVAYVEQELQVPETTYVERCEYVQTGGQQPSESAKPPAEVLPEGATQQRYYYQPGEQSPAQPRAQQPAAPSATETPGPGELPPPPVPSEGEKKPEVAPPAPENNSSGRSAAPAAVVQVEWRPVWNSTHSVAQSNAAD